MENLQPIQTQPLDDAQKALNISKKILTFNFEDIPPWMQNDPFIRRGYRKQLNLFTECFRSLFYLHNESINTWSHLLAAVCFFIVIVKPRYAITQRTKASSTDKNVILMYNMGTAGCLLFSVSTILFFIPGTIGHKS